MSTRMTTMRQRCALALDDKFISQVKFAQVLYESPFLGVLITQEGKVFALGAGDASFGLGSSTVIPKLTEMDTVNSLEVKKMCSSTSNHVLVLTESGVIYSWGHGANYQLGNNSTSNNSRPAVVTTGEFSDGQIVIDVGCGSYFSAALTKDGKVFTWGHNQYGQTGQGTATGYTQTPKLVSGLSKEKIGAISCFNFGIMCLNDRGRVFAFGQNTNGQCGQNSGSYPNVLTPMEVKVPGNPWIQDLKTGLNHTLALANDGSLYAWGYSDRGQVGTGGTSSYTPTKIMTRNVMSIAAVENTSYAIDVKGDVYVWGNVSGSSVTTPTKSAVEYPESDNIPLVVHANSNKITKELSLAFDDKTTADVIFRVDSKDIHVHRAVLTILSEYFKTMFNGNWKEKASVEIEIKNHGYDVYRSFLRYFYCGEVGELTAEQFIQLMDLAKLALDNDLLKLCKKRIKTLLEFSSVADIFSLALTMEQEKLAHYCVRFAMRNMKAVMESESFGKIPGEHVREFLIMCKKHGSFMVEA